jgi:hypothetical protein
MVEENLLSTYPSSIALANSNVYGIVKKNSGDANNRIYKNVFTYLRVGTQAEGDNEYTDLTVPDRPINRGLHGFVMISFKM